jgi:hypothetical protein
MLDLVQRVLAADGIVFDPDPMEPPL